MQRTEEHLEYLKKIAQCSYDVAKVLPLDREQKDFDYITTFFRHLEKDTLEIDFETLWQRFLACNKLDNMQDDTYMLLGQF